jgi:hypothetical protein
MTETAPHAPKKVRRLGPYSGRALLAKLGQRTREARLLHDTKEELTAHIGGSPSATQKALIDRGVGDAAGCAA